MLIHIILLIIIILIYFLINGPDCVIVDLRIKTRVFLSHLKKKYENTNDFEKKEVVKNILKKYGGLCEGDSTYVRNKKKIKICISESGGMNILMYGIIHELAHIGYVEKRGEDDHCEMFWRIYKFLLTEALSIGLIFKTNFQKKNAVLCGEIVDYNVLYDPMLKSI
jgi:hypothetical protein